MLEIPPAERDLVLVGGGHAHALALRALAMQDLSGLRITLISPAAFTPYSGMLPGLIAGHYSFEETHIDLVRLCQWAGVRFLCDTVVGLDPARRQLHCAGRGPVGYDILSLDTGSQPELASVPGAREHAVPVKPVAGLWSRWRELRDGVRDERIAVVGGGAGSVEVALAMAHHLGTDGPRFSLYSGAAELLPGYGRAARRRVMAAMDRYGIRVECGRRVASVDADCLRFEDGDRAPFDTLIWCTGAAAAEWVAASGLRVDERGFLLVKDTLQSVDRPEIFAAGDIATQRRHPRPKAGVYAVRQGPVLARNLLAFARGQALREHRPQRRFLSLLSLGERRAVAERHGFSLEGAWVWRWKDRIDREFMQRFSDLAPGKMTAAGGGASHDEGLDQAPCGGCGAKVGAAALGAVLTELRNSWPEAVAAEEDLDDAAVLDPADAGVQSVDALRALVDEPLIMGRIAAQHALSDLYASGARPTSAQALLTLPFASGELLRRDLRAILEGALGVFAGAGCRLVGGHTMQGPELQIGFAVNGTLDAQPALRRHGARAGDRLLLTAPLGSGVLFAAHMQGRADGRDVQAALAVMQRGNRAAAGAARRFGARAVTDVTGFGLAGHLLPMLTEDLQAVIDARRLPLLPGARDALVAGLRSTLDEANREAFAGQVQVHEAPAELEALLYDPQTGGGLLIALPDAQAESAREALAGEGIDAAIIGSLRRREDGPALLLEGAGQLTRN